jgi:hypothetical protein
MDVKAENKNNECVNCNTIVEGNYCTNCGQKANQKRYTLKNLPGEFVHGFFHINSGLLFTIKELFIRPGVALRGYIAGKRVGYFNPFTFLVLIGLVAGYLYTRSGIIEHVNDILLASSETIDFTRKHFSFRMLMAVPSYSVMCWILFRSYRYNIAEYLVISTFLISQGFVIMIVWLLFIFLVKPSNTVFTILYFSSLISLVIYQVVAFFRLFNKGSKVLRWLSASVVVVMGLGLSFILVNYTMKIIKLF